MRVFPLISIVIPTYNSSRTLELSLKSIRKQTYPQNKIEVLVVDGGSDDKTIEIAKNFDCKIIDNPKTDIVNAEYLGFKSAKGKYLVGLAPDEVFENKNSLLLKTYTLERNPEIKSVLPTGYKTPKNYSSINFYINEFGDPFSYFVYRDSKDYRYLINDLRKKYKSIYEDKKCIIFTFLKQRKLPLIELWAGGCMIDLEYVKIHFPEINKNPSNIPLIFYLLNKHKKLLGVTKNDPTLHYSVGNLSKYLKKIRSRVEFNIFKTPMGKGGFYGRQELNPDFVGNYKYFFIPYSFSLIFPVYDALYLTLSRKENVYLLHPFLSIYTSLIIIYYYVIKILKLNHRIKLYGQ